MLLQAIGKVPVRSLENEAKVEEYHYAFDPVMYIPIDVSHVYEEGNEVYRELAGVKKEIQKSSWSVLTADGRAQLFYLCG